MVNQKLIKFLEENGKGDLTWQDLADKFGLTISQCRYAFQQVNQLKLRNQTLDGEGEILFEKYQRYPKEQEKPDGNFQIKRYTTYNGVPTWVTHEKKPGDFDKSELTELIKSLDFKTKKFKYTSKSYSDTELFTFTDVHLGMSTRGNLFDLDWCLEKYYSHLDIMISNLPKKKNITFLQLGDFTDGMKSKTNRGGHVLQQNMNDKEMFKYGLESMIYLLDAAVSICGEVEMIWVANSNHPGVTDYAIGTALAEVAANRYDNVVVDILEDSFSQYEILGKNFIITHGYDEEFMKRGLPRFLNNDQISKIRNLKDFYKMDYPIMLRGDLHQDHSIDYGHFRDSMTQAFSPPSGWISNNFFSADPGGFKIIKFIDGELEFLPISFKK